MPASQDASVVALAAALPDRIRLGTSTWSFPGWEGLVYAGAHSTEVLARHGLSAYAAHPLLRTVGLDRSFYGPVPAADLQRYALAAPPPFGMVVKCWDELTLPAFPRHARYGDRAGMPNPNFLDPSVFLEQFWAPFAQAYAAQVDAVVLEFSPMRVEAAGGVSGFVARLDAFLEALPRSIPLAVELRNTELMVPAYARVLQKHDATHVYNRWAHTPPLSQQVHLLGAPWGPHTVARLMLPQGQSYEDRLRQCAPFHRLVDQDPQMRADVAMLARLVMEGTGRLMVVVNNKAEGSAPLTVMALAEGIVRALG